MIPQEQVRDIRNALTFLERRARRRSGAAGALGHQLRRRQRGLRGNVDRRVACTVSLVGVGNGLRWDSEHARGHEWLALQREIEADWRQQVLTGESRPVDRTYLMLPGPAQRRRDRGHRGRVPEDLADCHLETARR